MYTLRHARKVQWATALMTIANNDAAYWRRKAEELQAKVNQQSGDLVMLRLRLEQQRKYK